MEAAKAGGREGEGKSRRENKKAVNTLLLPPGCVS